LTVERAFGACFAQARLKNGIPVTTLMRMAEVAARSREACQDAEGPWL